MGSNFLFDMPLATIRKRERDDALPENMPFIKADKTNRTSFSICNGVKSKSNYVAWGRHLWTLLGSMHGTSVCIFKLK